jgi:N6-adenosine-specific RNA methylase IME4
MDDLERTIASLLELKRRYADGFSTILADPPWRFKNRTGKVAPEHRRLYRYSTLSLEELMQLPVSQLAKDQSHLYLWCPNAIIPQGLRLMEAWGFEYKTMLVWYKVRKDGGPDGRGVGFYFRNVTEPLLFGVRGRLRTLASGRRQVNILISQKREHSTKPFIVYEVIQSCSPGPYLELFARRAMPNWVAWGDEVDTHEQQEILPTLDELLNRYRGPGQFDPRTFWRDWQGG